MSTQIATPGERHLARIHPQLGWWFLPGLLGLGLLTGGCATGKRSATTAANAKPSAPAQLAAEPEPVPPPVATTGTGTGTISRPRLLAVLERGIPAFLGTVDVDAIVDAGRFKGWRWKGWRQPAPADGLVEGDLLVAANGESLERPETFTRVWQSMRKANALDLDIVRQGKPTKLHYDVVP